jgi:outer membrane protein TolC
MNARSIALITGCLVAAARSRPAVAADLDAELAAMTGQAGGLTAAEAGRRAAQTSFEARGKLDEVRATAAEVDRAFQGFYPRLSLMGRYTRLSELEAPVLGNVVAAPTLPAGPLPPGAPLVSVPLRFPILLDQTFVQLNLTVPVSDYLARVAPALASARHGEAGARLDAERARQAAALQGKMAYYAWVRAQFQRLVAAQTLRQAEAHRAAVKSARDFQRASDADLLQAEARVADAQLLLARTGNFIAATLRQVRLALHETAGRPLSIGDRFDEDAAGAPDAAEALEARALARRVELKALDERIAALGEQRRAARGAAWPRLDAFANGYLANPNARVLPPEQRWQESWDVGVQLSYTFNELPGASAQERALEARREALASQRAALADAIRAEVSEAARALADAGAALDSTRVSLKAADEALRVRRLLFSAGEASAVQVVDAEAELLGARLQRIAALVDRQAARARLEHALGEE